MKGKALLLLFALPFFGVGAWMLISISGHVLDAWQMSRWEPVPAQLTRAGYEQSEDSYKAFATYHYTYQGQSYTGNRVAIAGGGDNIGNFQVNLGNRLAGALSRGESVEIYVNPENPQDAVVDRTLRWGLIGLKSIFVLAFGGFGLGLIIYLLRKAKEKDPSDPKYRDRPWLVNKEWQTSAVRSHSRSAMYSAVGFATFWNLVSAPLPFVIHREVVEAENYLALIGLLFPLVGIGLIVRAARRSLEWRRFGPAPVMLDPFPAVIGGCAGGTIDFNVVFDSSLNFELTLGNIYSYMTGSGKNRRRNERVEWEGNQVVRAAPGSKGTRLVFKFEVPEGLAESDAAKAGGDYHLWRLNVKAELAGIDIGRDYEIPVYTRGEQVNLLAADN